jgi:DNA-binding NarL/FixJ family response regulator
MMLTPATEDLMPGYRRSFQELSPHRQLAETLILAVIGQEDGTYRLLTRAEIEREVMARMRVSRNAAQSAATKAVTKLDPGNPARRTHKPRVAHRIDRALEDRMMALKTVDGMTNRRIAELLNANERTVGRHLSRRKGRSVQTLGG